MKVSSIHETSAIVKISEDEATHTIPQARIYNAQNAKSNVTERLSGRKVSLPPTGLAILDKATITNTQIVARIDGENTLLKETLENAREARNDPKTPGIFLEEAAFFDKKSSSNYGHFLVEILPRILFLREEHPEFFTGSMPLIFRKGCRHLIKKLLPDIGIEDGNFLFFSEEQTLFCERLYWPIRNTFHPDRHAGDAIRRIRSIVPASNSPTRKSLFISRRDASCRSLVNDTEVFALLQGFDPSITHVECGRMTFAEQVKLFSEADLVVATHGAALTNCIFLPPSSSVIMLTPPNAGGYFFQSICSHIMCNFSVVFGSHSGAGPALHDSDYTINVSDLGSALNDLS